MEIILTSFMSLDGVVQAPGGPEEDTDGGFAHGGWSHPYFDPETMGSTWDAVIAGRTRCSSEGAPGRGWPRPGPNARVTRLPTS